MASANRRSCVALLYSEADSSFAHQLESMFKVLELQGAIELWSQRRVLPGEDLRRTLEYKIESADILLLLISADFIAGNDRLIQLAVQQAARRGARVIPVLLRPALLPPALSGLSGLPRDGRPITSWSSRDEALLDVVSGVQNIIEYSVTSQERQDATPASVRGQPAWNAVSPPEGAPVPIHQIFRTDGPPAQTFVAPVQFDDLRSELGVLGRGLIVEGPSKVGKSTAVRAALALLPASGETVELDGKFLSADDADKHVLERFESTLGRIVAGTFAGHLIIDDFHYVEEALKTRLARRMKALADQARPAAKVTIIGINPIGHSLLQLVPDLAGRARIIKMNRQPDPKLAELIIRGEAAAGVRFRRRDEIVNEADGSFYVAQLLCQRLLGRANITDAQRITVDVDLGPQDVIDGIRDDLHGRYHDQIRDFAAHDLTPPPRGAGLALLWLLSRSKNGDVSIQEAIFRYPLLTPAFEWLRASNLGSFFQTHTTARELLYYNRAAGTLSIEDPQLKFFLRKLDWGALASASGHVNVQFHPLDGPLFTSAVHATPIDVFRGANDPGQRGIDPGTIKPQGADARAPVANVLHLSDLHIATLAQSTVWYAQLAADLRQQRCDRLSALVVSGDVANLSTPEEYKAARMFLEHVMSGFGLSPRQLILVPGNHDLNWVLAQDAYSLHKRSRYSGQLTEGAYISHGTDIIEVRDDAAYKLRFKHFAELYREVKGEEYPLEYDQQGTVHRLEEHGLLFLGLSSAWQIDHVYRDRAGVHDGAVARSLLSLGPPAELRIAVFHHPVHSSSEDRIKDSAFLQQLAVAGFRLALHGHLHKSDNHLFRYDMSPGGRRIDLVGGGTFGAATRDLVPGYPLQYNLLRVGDKKVIVETRRKEEINGAWAPDARWLREGRDPEPRYEIDL